MEFEKRLLEKKNFDKERKNKAKEQILDWDGACLPDTCGLIQTDDQIGKKKRFGGPKEKQDCNGDQIPFDFKSDRDNHRREGRVRLGKGKGVYLNDGEYGSGVQLESLDAKTTVEEKPLEEYSHQFQIGSETNLNFATVSHQLN